jgi:predicted dehydrogenase
MSNIKCAVVGLGFISGFHIDAIRRVGFAEVSAGRKCHFNFEIDGTKASMYWNQETCDWMWMGYRDKYNKQVMRNPNLMAKEVSKYTSLYIVDSKKPGKDIPDFATFDDAHYIIKLTEAILESSRTKRWVKV